MSLSLIFGHIDKKKQKKKQKKTQQLFDSVPSNDLNSNEIAKNKKVNTYKKENK